MYIYMHMCGQRKVEKKKEAEKKDPAARGWMMKLPMKKTNKI